MPQISAGEFERLPLRVHDFLAGVPLYDVWAVDLPHARSGSRWMSSCARRKRVLAHRRRSCVRFSTSFS